jgi:hypothetical protein
MYKFFIYLLLTFSSVYSLDTTLLLKNGDTIRVDLIDENPISIVYKNLTNGNSEIISKEEVVKIIYSDSISTEEDIKKESESKKFIKKRKKNAEQKSNEYKDDSEFELSFFNSNFLIHPLNRLYLYKKQARPRLHK